MYHDHSDLALFARPCRCPEPAADPHEFTCVYCGRQVDGKPLPVRAFGIRQSRMPQRSVPLLNRKRQPRDG